MKKQISLAFVVAVLFTSQSWALTLPQAVAGGGKLVMLKGEDVSGVRTEGDSSTSSYLQQVVYQGSYRSILPRASTDQTAIDPTKLSCMGTFDTSNHIDAVTLTPGAEAIIPAGTELSWSTSDLDDDRWDTFVGDDGLTHEALTLVFYGDNSRLSSVTCTIEGKGTLPAPTVQDFENATGGRMTLIQSQ